MKVNFTSPPRKFTVGNDQSIEISDMGSIELNAQEQVTFIAADKEYDVTAKEWGFYATPSVNGRLKRFGWKTALVRNQRNQHFIMLVDPDKRDLFDKYCVDEEQTVVEWLDERPEKS